MSQRNDYIIKEPFQGYSQSIIYYAGNIPLVAYSSYLHNDNKGDLCLSDYLKRADPDSTYKVVTSEELDQLMVEYEDSQITDPVVIDKDRFFDMLDILPPCRWGGAGGWEVFHISERLSGDLVSWFACSDDHYFEFVDRAGSTYDHLRDKLNTALKLKKHS